MTTLLDNVTAAMVGMAVLFMVVMMQQRAQESAVHRSISYAATKQSIEFGRWIQDDMANVGAGVSFGTIAVEDRSENPKGFTSYFKFRRKIYESDPLPSVVAYVLKESKKITVDGKEVQLYRLDREVNGEVVGSSMPNLISFELDMLDNKGIPTATPSDASQLRIQFSSAMPFRTEQKTYLQESHWSTTVPLRES